MKMIGNKYVMGVVLFDEDEQLFYCKVGIKGNMKLLYTVWGKSEQECRLRSEGLIEAISEL